MNLEKEPFEAWLDSQPDDRVIHPHNPHGCFGVCFIRETTNCKCVVFGQDRFSLHGFGGYAMKLPEWFQQLVDRHLPIYMTCGEMKARYKQLFGSPETTTVTTLKERQLA